MQAIAQLIILSIFIAGCSQTGGSIQLPANNGMTICPPGIYDKYNLSGRLYSAVVEKCTEGKIYPKEHELCLKGPYNKNQPDFARNYNPTVDTCTHGIVVPIFNSICLIKNENGVNAQEYSTNTYTCINGKLLRK